MRKFRKILLVNYGKDLMKFQKKFGKAFDKIM